MLSELNTFIAVAETKSFTQAGQAVGLSQPAVSAHIKTLEQQFGIPLFYRANKQLIITEGGQILYKRAKEIMDLIRITQEDMERSSVGVRGALKIGASYTIGEYILPEIVTAFCRAYPEVMVELAIGDTAEISRKVCDFSMDLGFIEGLVHFNNLEQTYFKEDELVLLVPEDHPFADRRVSLEELDNQKWIVREIGSGTREHWDIYLSTHKLNYRSLMVFGSNATLKKAVRDGLGIGFASKELLDGESQGIAPAYLPETCIRQMSYIRVQNVRLSHLSELFLETFREFFPVSNSQMGI